VDSCAVDPGTGLRADPFSTLNRAITTVAAGATLVVQTGSYPERFNVGKALTLEASDGPVLIGQYYEGTRDICLPITDESCGPAPDVPFSCNGNHSSVGARIYYPARGPGDSQLSCGRPFPLVIYSHGNRFGALCSGSNPGPVNRDYLQAEGILAPLASAGVIVVSVDTSAQGDALGKGQILLNTIAFARDENERQGSLLQNAVDMDRVGLAGHSTGGAGAVHAALSLQRESCSTTLRLKTVRAAALSLLAPDAAPLPVPGTATLIIYGTNDMEQVDDFPLLDYGRASPPKRLIEVIGANHYGYTDDICLSPPEDRTSEVGGVTGREARARQQRAARDYVHAFFSVQLQGDQSQSDYLLQRTGQQCDNPGNPPSCGFPRHFIDELETLNVAVRVCSCAQ
jgi:hypothetical protein